MTRRAGACDWGFRLRCDSRFPMFIGRREAIIMRSMLHFPRDLVTARLLGYGKMRDRLDEMVGGG